MAKECRTCKALVAREGAGVSELNLNGYAVKATFGEVQLLRCKECGVWVFWTVAGKQEEEVGVQVSTFQWQFTFTKGFGDESRVVYL